MAETNLYVNSIIFGRVTKNRKLHKIPQYNDDVKSRLIRVHTTTFPFVHLQASSRMFAYRSTRLEDVARYRRQSFASLATEEEKRKSVRVFRATTRRVRPLRGASLIFSMPDSQAQ